MLSFRRRFISVFHVCVQSGCFMCRLHKVSFWIWMEYVSPQELGDVEQQNISFYQDATAWDKRSCCFSEQKANIKQCRRPLTHRNRAGWVHFLLLITNWTIVPGPRLLKLNCKSQIWTWSRKIATKSAFMLIWQWQNSDNICFWSLTATRHYERDHAK